MAGWEVFGATCSADGVEQAARTQPDAILLDVRLPDLDGPATLGLLQSNAATADIPVMFLTASVQAKERRELATLGARGVLSTIRSDAPGGRCRECARLAECLGGVLGRVRGE